MKTLEQLDSFTRAYIECALWSSTDNSNEQGGEPLDKNYNADDLAPATLARIMADCEKFQVENATAIGTDAERAGHDFWLTRNGHGAGFWDGDWPDSGDELTAISKNFGECNLYVGDDGKLYLA